MLNVPSVSPSAAMLVRRPDLVGATPAGSHACLNKAPAYYHSFSGGGNEPVLIHMRSSCSQGDKACRCALCCPRTLTGQFRAAAQDCNASRTPARMQRTPGNLMQKYGDNTSRGAANILLARGEPV